MMSPRRQQYFGIATGLFLVLLGAFGTINLALSDNLADRTVVKRSTVTGANVTGAKLSTPAEPVIESSVPMRTSGNFPPETPIQTKTQDQFIGSPEPSGSPSPNYRGRFVLNTAASTQTIMQPTIGVPGAKLPSLDGFKPRLPPYYSRLVTPQQRERIYWIQQRYYIEIEKQRSRINKLEQERDKLIQACLTASQFKQLMQWKGGAK